MLGFSITAGIILKWSDTGIQSWSTWLLFSVLLGAVVIGGIQLRKISSLRPILVLPLLILYLIGWLAVTLWTLPDWFLNILIPTGLVLITLLAAALLRRGLSLKIEDSLVPLGSKLWVLLLNLFWLCSLI